MLTHFISVVCDSFTELLRFIIQHFSALIGQDVAAASALYLDLPDHTGLQKLLQQVIPRTGANCDLVAGQRGDLIKDINSIALVLQAEQDVKHLLGQRLKLRSGHCFTTSISNIEFPVCSVTSNIEFVNIVLYSY